MIRRLLLSEGIADFLEKGKLGFFYFFNPVAGNPFVELLNWKNNGEVHGSRNKQEVYDSGQKDTDFNLTEDEERIKVRKWKSMEIAGMSTD